MENRLDRAFSYQDNQTDTWRKAPTTRTKFYYLAKQSSKRLVRKYTDRSKKKTIEEFQHEIFLTHPQGVYYCLGTSKRHGKERTIYCSISQPLMLAYTPDPS